MKKKSVLVSTVLLFAAQNVFAGAVCTTKVDAVYIDQTGQVVVHGTAAGSQPYDGWQVLCNANRTDGVGQLVCNYWLAMAGQAMGEQATTIVLQTSYQLVNLCSQIAGAFPFPTSVMISR
jgi:invasion protein IalB